MIITHLDAKTHLLCNDGIRKWCKTYGVDYSDFRKNGISEERLLEIGDPNGLLLLERVKNGFVKR